MKNDSFFKLIWYCLTLAFLVGISSNQARGEASAQEILLNGNGIERVGSYLEFNERPDFEEDKVLGFKTIVKSSNRQIRFKDGKVIYDYRYYTDSFGRRIDPGFEEKRGKDFIMLHGCSYVFGQGVQSDETLSFFLNKFREETRTYNYGVGGTAPNYMLGDLRKRDFSKEIREDNGILLYFYILPHLGRSNGFMQELSWYKSSPFFEKENQKLIYKGSIEKANPMRTSFYSWLYKVMPFKDKFNLPPIVDSHYEYICDLIEASKKEFLSLYPKGDFLFVIHPLINSAVDKRLMMCLEDKEIEVLPMKIDDTNNNYGIKGDGHPNKHLNEKLAHDLLKILSPRLNQ